MKDSGHAGNILVIEIGKQLPFRMLWSEFWLRFELFLLYFCYLPFLNIFNHWRECLIHSSLKMNFRVAFFFVGGGGGGGGGGWSASFLPSEGFKACFFFFAFGQLRCCQCEVRPSAILKNMSNKYREFYHTCWLQYGCTLNHFVWRKFSSLYQLTTSVVLIQCGRI